MLLYVFFKSTNPKLQPTVIRSRTCSINSILKYLNFKDSLNAFVSLESFYNYNFFGPRKNPGNLVVWLSSSVYNNSFTEKFGNFCINIFSFQKREIGTNWYNGISANSIIKPNFTICTTNWSCAIFARFQKFFMLPPLNVSTFSLRVAIGKW